MKQVAALQMVSGPDRDANLKSALKLLEKAADEGAAVAVLPEYFAGLGLPEAERVKIAEPYGNGPIQEFLATTAQKLGLWIVGGSIALRSTATHVRGASLVFNDSGCCVGRFDKQHLFDVEIPERNERYLESEWTEAGSDTLVIDTPCGRMGIAICYDLRFPELFRSMLAQDVEWFAIPAAFTAATGRAHWEILCRARAIENLCYVVAAAQGGKHGATRETWGHSMIVDAWGQIVTQQISQGAGVIHATIDLDRLRETRRLFPALSHRK